MGRFDRSPVSRLGTMNAYSFNDYNFTERTRFVLAHARDEAIALGHEYVGTEHVLLAITADTLGVSAAVLANLGASAAELRERTLAVVQRGTGPRRPASELSYTSRAKKALELAMAEARELNHSHVGTEHLLLGLVREEKGIAAQMLAASGVTLETARAETLRLLGHHATGAAASTVGPPVQRPAVGTAANESDAWQRLLHALDATTRLGGTPSVALEDDGSLSVSLGPDLLVSVTLPPDARVRRRLDREVRVRPA